MTHSKLTKAGTEEARKIIEALAEKNIEASIARTYRDYGQNWTWDTILVRAKNNTYQTLSPRQFEDMNNGALPLSDFNHIINQAVKFNS